MLVEPLHKPAHVIYTVEKVSHQGFSLAVATVIFCFFMFETDLSMDFV